MADEGTQEGGSADGNEAEGGEELQKLQQAIESERKATKAEKQRAAKLESRLKQFDGIDPDEVRALLEEKARAEEEKAKAEGDFEKIRERLEAKHAKERERLESAKEELEGHVRRLVVDAEMEKQIGKLGVLPEYRDAVRLLWQKQGAQMAESDDGGFKAVIKDEVGDLVPLEKFAEEWSQTPEAGAFLPGTNSGGAGTDPGTRRTRDGVRVIANTPENLARYAEEIIEGEVVVDSLQQSSG